MDIFNRKFGGKVYPRKQKMAMVCSPNTNNGKISVSNNYIGVFLTTSSGKNFSQCFGH